MKTNKYSVIVKVRKQQLDDAENNLNVAKQRQLQHQRLYELCYAEFLMANSLPTQGSISELKSSVELSHIGQDTLNRAKEKVELSKKEMAHYQFLYKKAYMDYEKIKALEGEELKKIQKQMLKDEQKFLDEIAITRFFTKDKDVKES
ncbi:MULTISPECIES: flagellar export protein FliJ [unclassified Campylobacter]|uniref:flagellar export protein FliJ n=1 Tax=unclassified Campylobacter TaxID=2593542 RepID=UPI001237F612|nr:MULTISPECIES: flagellar export protein FliJ [unclassified Campylobacter]KAA6227249.1 hypothetical protein FMM57_04745 [Campylobacter sp. LR286c]KAA6227878.1 hypothetical protein FMM54_01735 [Campylobacter sp. LR185c]KAA6228286.1 hypothetical protein FMM55_01540 [Campylobacter sp. LR196d]KAA6229288.1 hypothetical protein FMM58_07980 [Campylobacter sp. LR291e]KAA6231094.1 hypothetical protein FMM56_05245 [Campylobacter sp. LR264d]